jgi:hypothetical protein
VGGGGGQQADFRTHPLVVVAVLEHEAQLAFFTGQQLQCGSGRGVAQPPDEIGGALDQPAGLGHAVPGGGGIDAPGDESNHLLQVIKVRASSAQSDGADVGAHVLAGAFVAVAVEVVQLGEQRIGRGGQRGLQVLDLFAGAPLFGKAQGLAINVGQQGDACSDPFGQPHHRRGARREGPAQACA